MSGFTITEGHISAITETPNFCIQLLLIDPPFGNAIKQGDILLVKRPSRLHALEIDIEEVEHPPSPLPYLKFTLLKGRVSPDGVFPMSLEDSVEN